MKKRTFWVLLIVLPFFGLGMAACGPAPAPAASVPTPAPERALVPAQPGEAERQPALYLEEATVGKDYYNDDSSAGRPAREGLVERMVISTAQIEIIVEDVETSLPQVEALVKGLEGYIVSSSSYRTATDRLAATVTLRVPAARFQEVLQQLRGMAWKVQSESLSGEDVTDQYVDLEARLKALQATEEELLALLKEVRQSEGNAQEKAQAILSIYEQLTSVRSQIEQIQGQMQYLEQMSAMATITVYLYPREPEVMQPVVEEGFSLSRIVNQAARTLVSFLQGALGAIVWFAVAILPIVVAVAIPLGLLVWWLRRRHRKRAREQGQSS